MVKFTLYVEGGGDSSSLKSACRKAFKIFLENAGLQGAMPRIVACGGRREAYNDFRAAVKMEKKRVFLLVDSEGPVDVLYAGKPWQYLAQHTADGWEKPEKAAEENVHLMVECMENWFLADRDALKTFYGQRFKADRLPARADIESVSKQEVFDSLEQAGKECKKGKYSKGTHAFKILEAIDPHKVMEVSGWARRFVETLQSAAAGRSGRRPRASS
jgi:hypothetical protein